MLQGSLQNLESVYLGTGGHFVQETYPNEIGQGLSEWLKRV
ncbi:hypothetical protein [Nitratireductor sp. XY-223]|nr:hypothetical protein [Nitratireductor sp. XY-223]